MNWPRINDKFNVSIENILRLIRGQFMEIRVLNIICRHLGFVCPINASMKPDIPHADDSISS